MNITRIHPDVESVPEYDPFEDVISLGPHDNMTAQETLKYAFDVGYNELIIIGTDENFNLLYNSSKMSRERMLYLIKRLEVVILQNPEEDE